MRRYHTCGWAIVLEKRWTGQGYENVYRDDEETSGTAGEAIVVCPGCGEFILYRNLSASPPVPVATWPEEYVEMLEEQRDQLLAVLSALSDRIVSDGLPPAYLVYEWRMAQAVMAGIARGNCSVSAGCSGGSRAAGGG